MFDEKQTSGPVEIKNLEDLFVTPAQSKELGYGFKISHEDGIYEEKTYFFKEK